MVQIINPLTIVKQGGGGINSISITNKSDYASPISLPTTGVPQDGILTVVTDPANEPYMVSSSNEAVARVVYDNGGYKLRLIGPGTATITAYSGNKSDTVTVTTTQATTAITITSLPAFCDVGTTYQLNVLTYTPASSAPNGVTWSSSNTSVATVDPSTGLVSFVAAGSVTITATVNGYSSVTKTTSANVVVNVTDPDFDAIHALIAAGTAEATYPVGSRLNVQYSENGGTTTYTMPLLVMDYRQVEIEGGTTVNGMVIQPEFTTIVTQRYSGVIDAVSLTASSGETVALDGYYYYSSSNVPLNYQPGDTLDFSTYPTIIKSSYNVDTAAKMSSLRSYGDRRWAYSNARSWLENTYKGYYSTSFTNHLGKVKVTTVDDTYVWSGAVRDTYDYFYLPSNVELLAGVVSGTNYTQNQVNNEGTVLQYYVDAAGTSTPSMNATAQNSARRKAAINAQTTYQNFWTRSVHSSSQTYEWLVLASGRVYYGNADSAYRLSPLAVLI